jgi:hypothetical protein
LHWKIVEKYKKQASKEGVNDRNISNMVKWKNVVTEDEIINTFDTGAVGSKVKTASKRSGTNDRDAIRSK